MHRRTFLKHMAVTPVTAASLLGSTGYLSMMSEAVAASGKTLVVIFQRGGCDGLNTVIPYGEDEYYNLRPGIAIAPPGAGTGTAIDLDGFFGLHPALSAFRDIYQQGDMGIMPNVHYSNGNRSHFSSQDLIESGSVVKRLSDGWLNRFLANYTSNSPLRATSFGGISLSLQGSVPVGVMPDLSTLQSSLNNSLSQRLKSVFEQPQQGPLVYRKLLNKHGLIMLNEMELLNAVNYETYSPENGAVYPESEYGRQLRQTAYLIKSGLGLEVCTISHDGWDHHAGQGGAEGKQADRLADFSKGIAALYNDLGPNRMNDVVILTMTEFGRTAKQNASGGTDHGNASSWFVIGGKIRGGIYGDWPGLRPENLYLQRYLKHSIDFRDIFSEVITGHFGNTGQSASLLPGYSPQPVGFL